MNVALQADEVMRYRDPQFKVPAAKLLPTQYLVVDDGTALVTVRSASAHEWAIRTLMDWGVEVDEAMFLGGLDKGPFLEVFEPDFYFDDQTGHCESAARAGPTGHVICGVSNVAPIPTAAAAVR